MNVSLTPQLEALVNEKVKSGRYGSASEVVREALRLLDERDQLQAARLSQLRSDVKAGLDQLNAKKGVRIKSDDLSDMASRIKKNGRQKQASGR